MPDEIDRECPVCGTRKLLRFFRRWRGAKRILHATCNACDEVTLSAMRPAQRLAAVANGKVNVSPLVVERLNERDLLVRRTKISGVQRAVHSGKRRQQWEKALGTRIRNEREWARRNLANLPLNAEAAGLRFDAMNWAAFFEAYINVLSDMIARYVATYNRVGTSVMPNEMQSDPLTYVFPETQRTLRDLYIECRPLRGRRFFRDPWFLTWQEKEDV